MADFVIQRKWNILLRVLWTINQHWFRTCFGAWEATPHYLIHIDPDVFRHMTSLYPLGLNIFSLTQVKQAVDLSVHEMKNRARQHTSVYNYLYLNDTAVLFIHLQCYVYYRRNSLFVSITFITCSKLRFNPFTLYRGEIYRFFVVRSWG